MNPYALLKLELQTICSGFTATDEYLRMLIKQNRINTHHFKIRKRFFLLFRRLHFKNFINIKLSTFYFRRKCFLFSKQGFLLQFQLIFNLSSQFPRREPKISLFKTSFTTYTLPFLQTFEQLIKKSNSFFRLRGLQEQEKFHLDFKTITRLQFCFYFTLIMVNITEQEMANKTSTMKSLSPEMSVKNRAYR